MTVDTAPGKITFFTLKTEDHEQSPACGSVRIPSGQPIGRSEETSQTKIVPVQQQGAELHRSGHQPALFIVHRGVAIFHAYKDELSDIPLGNWYSTTESALPGSEYEFDVRDLRRFMMKCFGERLTHDEDSIKRAIDLGLLQSHGVPGF